MTLYGMLEVFVMRYICAHINPDKFNDTILICSKQGHKTSLKSWVPLGKRKDKGGRKKEEEKVSRQKSERERERERGGCGLARSDLWRVAERGV